MEKYYVPEIEEFYVGFEFYIKDHKKEFFKAFVKPDIFCRPDLLKKYISDNSYKVKYLDKDDIEDLGFKLKLDVYEDGSKMYFENDEGLQLSYRFYEGKDSPLVHLFDYDSRGRMNTRFSMKVKNKGKLKQLLRDKI